MKIVKAHKNRSAHSEAFGIWSGKTLAEILMALSGSVMVLTEIDNKPYLSALLSTKNKAIQLITY